MLSRNVALVKQVRQMSCFGFKPGTRDALFPALNAKLSEYAASVGLAALDGWPYTRIALTNLARTYSVRLASLPGIEPMPGLDGSFAGSTFSIMLDHGLPDASEIAAHMAKSGVETRRWWAEGCHAQSAFANCPTSDLSVTKDLARRVLGLPFHLGIGPREINVVIGTLADALVTSATAHRGLTG